MWKNRSYDVNVINHDVLETSMRPIYKESYEKLGTWQTFDEVMINWWKLKLEDSLQCAPRAVQQQ